MKIGITPKDLDYIVRSIQTRGEIDKAIVFGARAKGMHKPYSDIDIALCGDDVSFDTISSLYSLLDQQGPLPYFFDIIDYAQIKNKELKEHIDRVGKVIFQR